MFLTALDITPPSVTVLGANPQKQEAGQPWTNAGATAVDGVSGPIAQIQMSPPTGVNVMLLGTQIVSF